MYGPSKSDMAIVYGMIALTIGLPALCLGVVIGWWLL